MPTERPRPAHEVRAALARPLFNPVLKTWVGAGELDYERYVRTQDLLALQTPVEQLVDPDELMFQVVHQAQEVWLKLLAHELAGVVEHLDEDLLWPAVAALERVVRIVGCLADELRVLETMTPGSFQVIRRSLGSGSGQESPGFNAVQTAAAYVDDALAAWLGRRMLAVSEVYGPGAPPDAQRICELLVDFDEGHQQWLFTHFMLVRRTIGVGRGIAALDGMPTQMLTGRMTKPLFRTLWKVREELTASWQRAGGHAPGATREPA